MDISAGLIQISDPGSGRVSDRCRLGNTNPENTSGRASCPRSNTDEDADRTGTHEVERCRVAGDATDDHRHLAVGDVLLEIEWLLPAGHVLGRHHGALNHEDVETGLECQWGPTVDTLRRQAGSGDNARRLQLGNPLADEVRVDRLEVDLLHPAGCLFVGQLRYLLKVGSGVFISSP